MSASRTTRGADPAMRVSGFTDPAFARLADLAHLLAGLVFPPNRQPSAEAGMRRAMTALRIAEPDALLRAARTPGEARDVVLAELTIGESYFFRDAAQLSVLANEILPARGKSDDPGRPLRVWSAGCASGEEPYTVAILLRELGWTHSARILGTDVARPRLEAARRARYTRWALRGVSEDRVARSFHRRGNYFHLDRSVRESVEFRALNLVHDDYSSVQPEAGGFDLVLCRNVMIYFDLPTVARIASGLLDSLSSDGWLVLGASDPLLTQLVPCEVAVTHAGIAYRRADGEHESRRSKSSAAPALDLSEGIDTTATSDRLAKHEGHRRDAPAVDALLIAPINLSVFETRRDEPTAVSVPPYDPVTHEAVLLVYEQADYPAAESLAIAALAVAGEEADTLPLWILSIRAVANQGRLHEAGERCARAIEIHPLAAELHSLHATLLAEAGWHSDAAVAARRVIYLDRTFIMGHVLLADALTRTGDLSGARNAFENVVALLADVEPDVPIAAADGVPAARLRQIATLRLRELTAAARLPGREAKGR